MTEQERENRETQQALADVEKWENGITPEPVSYIPVNSDEVGNHFLVVGETFILYKPSDALQKPPRKMVIPGYFAEDTVTMLYGQAGSYKTFWAIWEGIHLACGKNFCDLQIESGEKHKILYLSLEMTARDIADRFEKMTIHLTPEEKKQVNENFIILSAEDPAKLKADNDNSFLTKLQIICQENKFDIVYIDSFADYIAGMNIRDEGEMGKVIDDLRQFVLKNHVSFRIIHHGTKPAGDNKGSMAGIHTIRDLVDYVYLISAYHDECTITSDMVRDPSAKPRFGKAMTILTRFIATENEFSFQRIQESETNAAISRSNKILTIIDETPGITKTDLRKEAKNPRDFDKTLQSLSMLMKIMSVEEPIGGRNSKKTLFYTWEYWESNIKNTDQKTDSYTNMVRRLDNG